MAEAPVLVEWSEQGVAQLTLNNPPLNLVTLEMTERLIEVLDRLEGDDAVRAVVVTGAGKKAFCAGSDVKEFADVRDRVVEKKLAQENSSRRRIAPRGSGRSSRNASRVSRGLPGPAMRSRCRGFVRHGLPATHGKDRIDDVERGKGP